MNLARLKPQNRPDPGVHPVRICDHLRLINDCNIVIFIQIGHLHCGRRDSAALFLNAFLPRPHGTGHPVFVHLLVDLQGQQAQRAQIDPAPGQLQPLQRTEGLPAVGGTNVQDKMPVHFPHLCKFHLRAHGHQLQNLVLHLMLPILRIQGKQRILADPPGHGPPEPGEELSVHPLLLLFQKQSQIQLNQFGKHLFMDHLPKLLPVLPDRIAFQMPDLPVQVLQIPDIDPGRSGILQRTLKHLRLSLHTGIFRRFFLFLSAGLFVLFHIKLYQFLFIYHVLLPDHIPLYGHMIL